MGSSAFRSKHTIPLMAAAVMVMPACGAVAVSSFETAAALPKSPRRPDAVAIDRQSPSPPIQSTADTRDGLVTLQEPVDITNAMQTVRIFFRAVLHEDLEAMSSVLTSDAQQYSSASGNGMPMNRHWERRFQKFDHPAAGQLPFRESMTQVHRYQDLMVPLPGRPSRLENMTSQDILIRVPITRTRFGLDRVFGSEMYFLLQRQGREFLIRTLIEDFVVP